ncbi:hypothetical protein AT15_01300 [Kosmotoga arenicorallina S304]|uniref:Uncharacterized protein n=1 Tax=Kosmotoga arenicorallina S304 TaxID=1453497 RepID=A0A176K057_9BACT|nr:ABC-2 transporter permease [Kosmotoga arenicorallina]OAA29942.1 hypothetical protein AT15_01300 [Kosmotoga arenicorallina S304]
MLKILKKELTSLGVLLIFVSAALLTVAAMYLVITGRDLERTPMAVMDYLFILEGMVIFGLPMGNEKYDEKNKGYHLYGMLPVKKAKIVKAKFLAFLIPGIVMAFAIWLAHFIVLKGIYPEIVLGAVCVAFSFSAFMMGILYVFIFKLEYSKMLIPTMLTYMLVLSFPIWSTIILRRVFGISENGLIGFYTSPVPFAVVLISLICLYFLYKKAVRKFLQREF